MKSLVTHTATQPTVESLTDYYPFGMEMPGRSYVRKNGEDYRYGFQGQDKEKELWGGESSFFKYPYPITVWEGFSASIRCLPNSHGTVPMRSVRTG